MARRFTADLSVKGIDGLIKQLEQYKDDLNRKCQMVCERLAEKGIYAARASLSGGFGQYITFTIDTDPEATGGKAILVATQTGYITSQWKTKDGIKTADVSPLLMAEFGSGQFAVEGHRGTFPGQTHAFEDTWYWKGMDDKWHNSSGVRPQRPMHKAFLEMVEQIDAIVKEVFGNG